MQAWPSMAVFPLILLLATTTPASQLLPRQKAGEDWAFPLLKGLYRW